MRHLRIQADRGIIMNTDTFFCREASEALKLISIIDKFNILADRMERQFQMSGRNKDRELDIEFFE